MLSKHANIGFDVTDNMTIFEINSATEVLDEYYKELRKQAKEVQKTADGAVSTTRDVSDGDLMDFLP
jgi:hypothetical protein